MANTKYRYKVLACNSARGLEEDINITIAADRGWELVPGQSVAVTACVYVQDGEQRDSEWSYTVMMRTLV